MAPSLPSVNSLLNTLLLLTFVFINYSTQDDANCFQPEYRVDNHIHKVQLNDISLINCARVRRSADEKIKSNNVPQTSVENVTTVIIKNINDTSPPIIQTTPKVEVKLKQNNLGENGTGILRYNDCYYDGKKVDLSICDSKPIISSEDMSKSHFEGFSEPQEKLLADNNITTYKNDTHEYYNSTFIIDKEKFDLYWDSLINNGKMQINHLLSDSYRRAITIKPTFDFPFYGQPVKSITIATGGFIYTGDYVHHWLAATQYIAPLMANFDTGLNNNSYVKFSDNGTALTVIWDNVVLQENATLGNFTFATTLHSDGNIVFAYKAIPVLIESIQENSHPVKVGLSDAFITEKVHMAMLRRKTIYEYHRVDFKSHHIVNNTIITLTPLSTCPEYNSCKACMEHDTIFKCTWCSSVKRCSNGNDRQRQDWIDKHCDATKVTITSECPADDSLLYIPEPINPTYITSKNISIQDTKAGDFQSGQERKHEEQHESGGGAPGTIAASLAAIVAVVGSITWFLYAYRNPHTNSGQFLVKYRPSNWSWRRGEARYTAATIHM